ncbi:hypothetical protein [Streptacidiphilus sp. PAMC 29251]
MRDSVALLASPWTAGSGTRDPGTAESPQTLKSAVDRLTVAWEEHTRQLAASIG